MNRTVLALTLVFAAIAGCARETAPPPVKTGFLSTYRNLEQIDYNSWRYIDPNNRLARYDKFHILPIQLAIPDDAPGMETKYGDIKKVQEYLRQALKDAVSPPYEVVDSPAWDVANVRVAITDAADKDGRVGLALEAEVLDSVSQVQIGALVESQLGKNLTISRFWTEKEATTIMDEWAARLRAVIDEAHNVGEGGAG